MMYISPVTLATCKISRNKVEAPEGASCGDELDSKAFRLH